MLIFLLPVRYFCVEPAWGNDCDAYKNHPNILNLLHQIGMYSLMGFLDTFF